MIVAMDEPTGTGCSDTRCEHTRYWTRYGHDITSAIHGRVAIGRGTQLSAPLDFNGKDSSIAIGDYCDIAAFVTITTADSHKRCIELSKNIERKPVTIGDHVFIGQGATILGGTEIGHHSVIGAGVVLKGQKIPPYSRVHLQEPVIEPGFYER